MQPFNPSSATYSPSPIFSDFSSVRDLQYYIANELVLIQAAITALALGHLDKSYEAPAKPQEGDIRYSDGSLWNPGSGQGVYYYNGSVWKFLG